MRIAFRADASLQMGTGHVMRCLTLADALAAQGADCLFICREHQGNLIEQIRNKGYRANALPVLPSVGASSLAIKAASDEQSPAHSQWLGATQVEDAAACTAILAEVNPDWLIVDHYALDARWELALKPHYRKLMVIDDLADRSHLCDLLLDQTFCRDAEDYRAWVPASCRLLCGSQYALLRPEFAALRGYSLQRRANPQLRQLLITMGGVDKDNATGQVLEALRGCPLPAQCQITVVMGTTAPWLAEVSRKAQSMPWPTRVMVGVSDMAQLMADSDLAIGGKYQGEPIGNCRYSDITVFSFHPVKIITTAEGGMALTNDAKLAERMGLLRSHGITRDPALMTKEMEGPWYYQQVDLGYNYRMTDLQGALGASQIQRLEQYVARRHELALRYDDLLSELPVTTPWQHPDSYSGLHLYVIRLQLDKIRKSHREVFEALRAQDIIVNLHYIPVHTQPYYQKMGFIAGQFPEAVRYYSEAISIPMYPTMTEAQQDQVVAALRQEMQA